MSIDYGLGKAPAHIGRMTPLRALYPLAGVRVPYLPMRVTGVDFITVPTRDFGQADDFYGDVLGLERSKQWGEMPAARVRDRQHSRSP